MKKKYILLLVVFCRVGFSQVNITTGTYSQNFGTANITSWTNNSTFPGWYISGTFVGQANLGGSANSANTGGNYSYNCGSDYKIGSRDSGSSGVLRIGVVLRNTTGQTIRSIQVSYTGFQMSLATNGGAINTSAFDYIVSTTAPAITAGSGTSVPALNFSQLQSTATGGGNQLNWYPCTQSTAISSCVAVTIPNNSYILLRWSDVDDSNNDHHMAVDNIQVAFDMNGGTCATFLPVELLYFNAEYNGKTVDLTWASASEKNNRNFTVERSKNGTDFEAVLTVKGKNTTNTTSVYQDVDQNPFTGISYYRLKQTDLDGTVMYSQITAVETHGANIVTVFPNPTATGVIHVSSRQGTVLQVSVINATGQLVLVKESNNSETDIDISSHAKGIYTVLVNGNGQLSSHKIVYQ